MSRSLGALKELCIDSSRNEKFCVRFVSWKQRTEKSAPDVSRSCLGKFPFAALKLSKDWTKLIVGGNECITIRKEPENSNSWIRPHAPNLPNAVLMWPQEFDVLRVQGPARNEICKCRLNFCKEHLMLMRQRLVTNCLEQVLRQIHGPNPRGSRRPRFKFVELAILDGVPYSLSH
jgi:hypothetical protein